MCSYICHVHWPANYYYVHPIPMNLATGLINSNYAPQPQYHLKHSFSAGTQGFFLIQSHYPELPLPQEILLGGRGEDYN